LADAERTAKVVAEIVVVAEQPPVGMATDPAVGIAACLAMEMAADTVHDQVAETEAAQAADIQAADTGLGARAIVAGLARAADLPDLCMDCTQQERRDCMAVTATAAGRADLDPVVQVDLLDRCS
jgi:hypothetical protein